MSSLTRFLLCFSFISSARLLNLASYSTFLGTSSLKILQFFLLLYLLMRSAMLIDVETSIAMDRTRLNHSTGAKLNSDMFTTNHKDNLSLTFPGELQKIVGVEYWIILTKQNLKIRPANRNNGKDDSATTRRKNRWLCTMEFI